MTQLEDAGSPSPSVSPWATIWLRPRQTIERIVATRPTYLVLPLAMLGMVAGFYTQLAGLGLAGGLGDWRLALGFVAASAVFGLIWLFPSALVLSWVCRLLGGEASARQLRAVIAWSTVPAILGAVVVLVILVLKAAGSSSPVIDASLPWLGAAFGLWTAIVFMLMLGRVERFGFSANTVCLSVELGLAGVPDRLFNSHPSVSAVQHSRELDGSDAARGRLHLRLEIHLRLQPVFAAFLAAAVFGPHLRLRAETRRRRRVSPAEGRAGRLRQARGGIARRSHSDEGRGSSTSTTHR